MGVSIEHRKLIKHSSDGPIYFGDCSKNFMENQNQQSRILLFLSPGFPIQLGDLYMHPSLEHNDCNRRDETSCARCSPAGSSALLGKGCLRGRHRQMQTAI